MQQQRSKVDQGRFRLPHLVQQGERTPLELAEQLGTVARRVADTRQVQGLEHFLLRPLQCHPQRPFDQVALAPQILLPRDLVGDQGQRQ
ncbi:hypothetical protein D9M71_763290 [compost metagenome]